MVNFVKNEVTPEEILKQSQMCGLAIEANRRGETVRGIVREYPLKFQRMII